MLFRIYFLYKLWLLLIIILKYYTININDIENLIEICENIHKIYPYCYRNSINCCNTIKRNVNNKTIELSSNTFIERINILFGKRNIKYGKIKETQESVIIKFPINENKLFIIKEILHKCNNDNKIKSKSIDKCITENIENILIKNNVNETIHICTNKLIKKLIAFDIHHQQQQQQQQIRIENDHDAVLPNKENKSNLTIYSYINLFLKPEQILLNLLLHKYNRMYIPKIKYSCGLFHIETNQGISLINYLNKSLSIRIQLAIQLIRIVIDLSEGITIDDDGDDDGYRFYLTDLTYDNIVVDPNTLNISIIDIDRIILRDTLNVNEINNVSSSSSSSYHKQHIYDSMLNDDECNCFSFVPEDLCNHYLSDINIYSVCQLFERDIFGNANHGLLHSIGDLTEKFPELNDLLPISLKCINCNFQNNIVDCDRFTYIHKLYNILLKINK